jgi:beta-lactam-binding protein with PASTA domain
MLTPDTMVDRRYRVLKRLGVGGMAEVWCAEDEVLGRRVALKLLGGRFATDPEFRERFRREAQAAAALTHPNIVGIFDRAEWEGTPYIAMELVDGQTLKEIVRERGPLPPHIAVGLTEQILRGLGYAHRRGIVHRDVKPQNVILDPEGQAKVADFGIARAGNSEMTQTGSIVGTVQYLSPEQANGLPVDHRSDLYSTGIVLYELLTGRVPFDGEAPVSVALKHVNELPVPPGQLRPGIPPALEAVVMRALEKDPNRRFQSADEFIAALEQARRAPTRQVVVEHAPDPWVEEEERRSRGWLWALAAFVIVAALAIGAYLTLQGDRVTVPNLVGRDAEEAARILQRRGLDPDFEDVLSDSVKRGEVISQNPEAGDEVREGSVVEVRVSAGRGTAAVPDVTGRSQDEAQQALRDAGFKTKLESEFSDNVPEGDVIGTSPPAGRQATKGRTITVNVSRGRENVTVPGVVGNTAAGASDVLQKAGLSSRVEERESSEPPGTVLEQNPAANATVPPGSTVTLIVAKERPTVPDVSTGNPTVEEATQALEDAGYKVKTVDRPGDPTLVGRVIGQAPEPGSRRSTGATVTIAIVPDPNATPTPTP